MIARAALAGPFGWTAIVRMGLVQSAIGADVVLVTAMLNRVLVVEIGLAALVPGLLIGFHYALQLLRPCWGHGGDSGGRRTPWIVGGMALLSGGTALATVAAALMVGSFAAGSALAVIAYALIGVGVGAAGTALLTMMAEQVAQPRRPAAAAVAWIMMIAGFVLTSGIGGLVLVPFGFARLERFGGGVALVAFTVSLLAVYQLEPRRLATAATAARRPFGAAVRDVWADPDARRFAIFIFVSMLAYGAEELILEPYAALAFGLPLGETAKLTALQNGGALVGMIGLALTGGRFDDAAKRRIAAIACLLCAAALMLIAVSGEAGIAALLRPAAIGLGIADGLFVVSALGLMMGVAGAAGQAGVRMGVFGAAQAIAFAAGGVTATAAVDGVRRAIGVTLPAYATVFLIEAALFVGAATLVSGRRISGRGGVATHRLAAAE